MDFSEKPSRFLHGADWPLASMDCYEPVIREAVPEKDWSAVFGDNALELFNLHWFAADLDRGYGSEPV